MRVIGRFGGGACGPEVLTLPALSWLPASPAGREPGAPGSGAPTRFGGGDSGRLLSVSLERRGTDSDPCGRNLGLRSNPLPTALPKSSFLPRPKPGLSAESPSLKIEGNGDTRG